MPGLDPGIYLFFAKEFFKAMDCRVKPGNDDRVCCSPHRDTCADTASHFPFCFAQQSVYRPWACWPSAVV
jgi:hypothetical protein